MENMDILGMIDEAVNEGNWLVQITTDDASFGLIVKDGVVVQAAPISKKSVGRAAVDVIRYYRQAEKASVQFIRLGEET